MKTIIRITNDYNSNLSHDYFVEKFEQTEINGNIFNSDPHDYTGFCIDYIEFPSHNDIINEYNNIYGIDYDEYIIEVD